MFNSIPFVIARATPLHLILSGIASPWHSLDVWLAVPTVWQRRQVMALAAALQTNFGALRFLRWPEEFNFIRTLSGAGFCYYVAITLQLIPGTYRRTEVVSCCATQRLCCFTPASDLREQNNISLKASSNFHPRRKKDSAVHYYFCVEDDEFDVSVYLSAS